MKVFKYKLSPEQNLIEMPRYAKLLHVGEQDGEAYVWAAVDPERPVETRVLWVVPTGVEIDSGLTFVGTVQFADGLVFHAFEETSL